MRPAPLPIGLEMKLTHYRCFGRFAASVSKDEVSRVAVPSRLAMTPSYRGRRLQNRHGQLRYRLRGGARISFDELRLRVGRLPPKVSEEVPLGADLRREPAVRYRSQR